MIELFKQQFRKQLVFFYAAPISIPVCKQAGI